MTHFSISYIALWALVVFELFLCLALLQQLEKIRGIALRTGSISDDHLPVGSRAPQLSLTPTSSNTTIDIRYSMLLFVSSECIECRGLIEKIVEIERADLPPLIVLCRGRERNCARFLERLKGKVNVVFDAAGTNASGYGVSVFPTAVAVDRQRRVRAYLHPDGIDQIKSIWDASIMKLESHAEAEQALFNEGVSTR